MSLAGKIVSTLQTQLGPIVIRYLQDGDAPPMLEFINALSRERTFVLFQGEQLTLDQEKVWLRDRLTETEAGSGVSLGAFSGERAVGSCGVIRKPLAETHVGVLGVSVTLEFRGHGIGGALIDAAISEATEHIDGLRIIELSVMGRTIRPANSTLHGVSSSMECCQAALRIEEGSSITCLCID